MLICHCLTVNERTIDASILAGARCPDEIAAMCGAGSRCGGCIPALEDLLDERREQPVAITSAA